MYFPLVSDCEESPLNKDSKPCIESLENCDNLNADPKPDEEALKEEECPLKPKTLKFKKVKDGKLSFAGSKTYTKLRPQESNCISPLKFVGNDPETESQTLRGYLDDEDEPEVLNAEDRCGDKDGCSSEVSRPKDRNFLTSLQEADIECVAVVCKRTPSMLQNRRQIFDETEVAINDLRHTCNDSKGDFSSKDIEVDTISESLERTSASVTPKPKSFSGGKLQNEQEGASCEKSYSRRSHSFNGIFNEMDTDSVDEGIKYPSSCSQEAQSGESVSSQVKFTPVDNKAVAGERDLCEGSKSSGDGTGVNCCNMQSSRGNTGSTCSSVVNSSMCSMQNDACKERSVTKIVVEDSDTEETDVTTICPDDDSSDDFQVSSMKKTQVAPPPVTQKPSKGKKRKATNKSKTKQKAANRGAKNCNSRRQPPADWSCNACTFINDGQLLECSICFTPRSKTDETACIVNDDDLSIEILNGRDRDDVRMADNNDLSEVRVDINYIGENCGMIGAIAKHDGSSQRVITSPQLTLFLDNQQTVELHPAESTIAYNLPSESMTTPPDVSKTTGKSTVLGEQPTIDVSKNSQVAEPALPPWACSVCTFLNLSELIECSICLTPRRRSQRLSASKSVLTVETEREVSVSKTTSNKMRRLNGDKKEKGEKPQEIDVEDGRDTFGLIPLDESTDSTTAHCDHDIPMAEDDGLTPEPVGSPHDTGTCSSTSHTQHGHEVSSEESSGEITLKPRKRLRLEDVEADNDIRDFSDDSDVLCNSRALTCSSTISSSTGPKELVADMPFDGKDVHIASPVDRVLSANEHEMEHRTNHKPKNCEVDNNDWEVKCKKLDVSDHSVEAVHTSEVSSTVSSEVTDCSNLLSFQQSGIDEVGENLEELKAAAEELFNSEWEDDDCWWEEESCSGQSSFSSSGETASSSPIVTSPVFTKCSDLYSVTELKNKLQVTPGQSNIPTTTVQQFERTTSNTENEMASSLANEYTFRPESAPVVEEEEEDEPEAVPEVMKLKFCLSLYTERVYLYDKVRP